MADAPFLYKAINTATTTTVKSGPGVLHSISIGAGTLGAITVYDNTSASSPVIINTFTPTAAGNFVLDVSFNTGLTIVTAAATVVTVSYR